MRNEFESWNITTALKHITDISLHQSTLAVVYKIP